MFEKIKKFTKDEQGTMTMNWVFLASGILGQTVASVILLNDRVVSASTETGGGITDQHGGAFF